MRLTNIAMYTSTNLQYAISEDNPQAMEPLNFNLGDRLPTSKFQVRSIVGLDAEDITPRFYGFGSRSGSRFYNFALKSRDIAMRVVPRPNYANGENNSDVRDELYRAISANRSGFVMLHFNAGATNIARIKGQIIKFEVDYFDKEPAMQITIRCDDPMFRSITPVEVTPPEAGLVTVEYPDFNLSDTLSTAPHGFTADFVFTGPSPSFIIRDVQDVDEYEWKFEVFHNFLAGDTLRFSSEFADKQLILNPDSAPVYLIDRVQPESVWPIVFPGENKMFFGNPTVIEWQKITFYAAYWGV